MPSAFTHAATAIAVGHCVPIGTRPRERRPLRFWVTAVVLSILPDADVVGFQFGIAYGDAWGHRGLSHSLVFAAAVGLLAVLLLFPRERARFAREGWRLWAFFTVVTASHGFMDALTDGGLGIAFFAPFDPVRYFFPWSPLAVAPIGIANFFTERGAVVFASELRWIWLPLVGLVVLSSLWRWLNRPAEVVPSPEGR